MKNEIKEYIQKMNAVQNTAINNRINVLGSAEEKYVMNTWKKYQAQLESIYQLFELFGVDTKITYDKIFEKFIFISSELQEDMGIDIKKSLSELVDDFTRIYFRDTTEDATFARKLSICLWVFRDLNTINERINKFNNSSSVTMIKHAAIPGGILYVHSYLLSLVNDWSKAGVIFIDNEFEFNIKEINLESFSNFFSDLSDKVNSLKGSESKNASEIDELRKSFKNLQKRFDDEMKNSTITKDFVDEYKTNIQKISKIEYARKALASSLGYLIDKGTIGVAAYLSFKTPD